MPIARAFVVIRICNYTAIVLQSEYVILFLTTFDDNRKLLCLLSNTRRFILFWIFIMFLLVSRALRIAKTGTRKDLKKSKKYHTSAELLLLLNDFVFIFFLHVSHLVWIFWTDPRPQLPPLPWSSANPFWLMCAWEKKMFAVKTASICHPEHACPVLFARMYKTWVYSWGGRRREQTIRRRPFAGRPFFDWIS